MNGQVEFVSKRTNPGWNLSRATLVLNKVYLETINIEKKLTKYTD